MRITRWTVRAAIMAGVLALAGTQASAGEKKKDKDAEVGGTAMGQATTGQQERSGTEAGASAQAGMSGQEASELTGRVESFDHDSKTFTVAGKNLKVDSSTEVTKDGEKAELTDINEGDEVRASYSGSGDTLKAERIEVMSSGSTSEPGKSSGTGTQSDDPTGRGGPMGPGTGSGQPDSAGTTSGTGTQSAPGSSETGSTTR